MATMSMTNLVTLGVEVDANAGVLFVGTADAHLTMSASEALTLAQRLADAVAVVEGHASEAPGVMVR